jgi:hypothetical protein
MKLQSLKKTLTSLSNLQGIALLSVIRQNRAIPVKYRANVIRTAKEKRVGTSYTLSKKQEELFKANPKLLKRTLEKLLKEQNNA